MASSPFEVIVVGGGLAGLAATMKLAELGASVKVFSVVPVKRSHSVCAQGGINAAVNIRGEGDSVGEHFDDTIYGGDFLANQEPVKEMTAMAPDIIFLFDRLGVPFNRTAEGNLDFRRFGGTKHHRTAFAGASTGQQLLYALDEQVRRREVLGQVQKFEYWEFLSLVKDNDGVCRGITAVNLVNREVKAFRADAVMLCTGGIGMLFGKSTNSVVNTGSSHASAYQQGAYYANGEFIQVHPTAIPGLDKLRLMSESARGEGGGFGPTKMASRGTSLKRSIPRTVILSLAISQPERSSMSVFVRNSGLTAITWYISTSATFRVTFSISGSERFSRFMRRSWATTRARFR